jgi:DNA-binding CsgD family transcriptional regulator
VVVAANGEFHYACVEEVEDDGWVIKVNFNDEGYSKIKYDAAAGGYRAADWKAELSPAEKKLVPLLAQRLSTKAIAKAMGISAITARGYIRLLRMKFRLQNRIQLEAFAQGLYKILEGGNGNGATREQGCQQGTHSQNTN